MKHDSITIENYLTELWPDWRQEIPHLLDLFNELTLEEGELLPNQRGDIYYLIWGTIGKYSKKEPLRYIDTGELIIIPLKPSLLLFKALIRTKVMLLQRPALYKIVEECPRSIILYDEILSRQQESSEFRNSILKLPKGQRLEAFRSRYSRVTAIISRKELADFLKISIESLRKQF